MRIGVVSDTHNHLKNIKRIVELFSAADVDRVIHTGDITQPKALAIFADLPCPLYGVFGNNDEGEKAALLSVSADLNFNFVDPPLELHWHNRRIIVVHDPLEFEGYLGDHHQLALHGHTHRYRLERNNSQLIFNPGECAGHMDGYNAVGVVDLANMTTEMLNF